MPAGDRTRIILRAGAAALVVAWFFVPSVRTVLPFWLPFAILVAGELEYLLRGLLEWRRDGARRERDGERGLPGADDADLGWGDVVEDAGPDGTVGLRWVPPPPRPPRVRLRRTYVVGSLVVAAIFYAALRADANTSWGSLSAADRGATERVLTGEAARIARQAVTVRCDSSYAYTGTGTDALGVAFTRQALAYLEPDVCRALHTVIASDAPVESTETAEAILVLAHEAVHLGGELREGVTECLGLQEGVLLAERLGFDRRAAQEMMHRRYLLNLGERSITRLTYRLPPSCIDTGALDLRPDDPAFP